MLLKLIVAVLLGCAGGWIAWQPRLLRQPPGKWFAIGCPLGLGDSVFYNYHHPMLASAVIMLVALIMVMVGLCVAMGTNPETERAPKVG